MDRWVNEWTEDQTNEQRTPMFKFRQAKSNAGWGLGPKESKKRKEMAQEKDLETNFTS